MVKEFSEDGVLCVSSRPEPDGRKATNIHTHDSFGDLAVATPHLPVGEVGISVVTGISHAIFCHGKRGAPSPHVVSRLSMRMQLTNQLEPRTTAA